MNEYTKEADFIGPSSTKVESPTFQVNPFEHNSIVPENRNEHNSMDEKYQVIFNEWWLEMKMLD